MISIVLPSYNGEKYIKESIESILNQTYQDIELILVDDCSSDQTWSIMQEYEKKDKRIKTIHNETNKKLPMSLNIGFGVAKGDYYTWTSDDNYYENNALEIMLNLIESKPDIGIVYADMRLIDSNGKINLEEEKKENDIQHSGLYNWVGACFLYRKKVHDTLNGYDTGLFLVEDFDFWLRAARYYKYYHIPKKLYYYRMHENSLTSTKIDKIMKSTIDLVKREIAEGYVKDDDKLSECYKQFLDYYYMTDNQNEFCKYFNLLSDRKYSHIRINYSYYIAKVIGIKAVKQIWKLMGR